MYKMIAVKKEYYDLAKKIANKENRRLGWAVEKALTNFARAKKLIPLVCMIKKG